MTAIRFLDNAPPGLIDVYEHANDTRASWLDSRVRSQSIAMLGRLISDTRMIPVWDKLSNGAIKLPRPHSYGMSIFMAAQEALVVIEGPRRSAGEEALLFSQISDLIDELRHRIDKAAVFGPCEVELFMTDDELRALSSLTDTPVGTPLSKDPARSTLSDDFDEFAMIRFKTWGIIPSLRELLVRFQAMSKRRAPSRVWLQPRAKHAKNNVFALRISAHIHNQYGRYWDDLVATFTTVALDLGRKPKVKDEISETLVQQLRRARTLPQPKSTDRYQCRTTAPLERLSRRRINHRKLTKSRVLSYWLLALPPPHTAGH
jgi:hypothetical protein